MAAEEKESERVVPFGDETQRGRVQGGGGFFATAPRALAAPLVDQSSRRHGREPRAWVVGDTTAGPLTSRSEQRLLHRVFAGVELPMSPHERAQDLRRELTQLVLDASRFQAQNSGGASITRRTSMGTLTKATIRDAISSARSSVS